MDILKMSVGKCMKDARIKTVLDRYIPELNKFPVMLFARKSCGELVEMAIKQGLFTREAAAEIIERINRELE